MTSCCERDWQRSDRVSHRSVVEVLNWTCDVRDAHPPFLERRADDRRLADAATAALRRIGTAAESALATDAERFAAADRIDYQRRRALGPGPVQELLRDMPEARRLVLAEAVAQDANPGISALGGETLLASAGSRSRERRQDDIVTVDGRDASSRLIQARPEPRVLCSRP